ncbi:hypothetical protein TNCV_612661 [Trichonephila clavipes]|nr:hypothetical protein TNCV_612661 [Trichonephila clavipes]
MHHCESFPRWEAFSPRCITVNRHQDWNEVALSPNMSFHLSNMSLDPRVKTIFGRPLFHWTCPAFHFTCPACHWTPVLKLFLGDLCFIGPVQHVILPVQHVILPVQHVIGPVQHVILPVQHVIGPVQHVILPVQHVIGPVQHVI